MNCTDRKEQVSFFIDGELEVREQVGLFQHLSGCKECQGFLDAMLDVRDLRRAESIPFPVAIDNAVLSMIQPRNAESRHARKDHVTFWQRRIPIPVPVAFAGVLAVAAVVVLLVNALLPHRERSLESMLGARQVSAQPTTVILVYGLPEVQVLGQLPQNAKVEKIVY